MNSLVESEITDEELQKLIEEKAPLEKDYVKLLD